MEKLSLCATIIIIGVNPNVIIPENILTALFQQAHKSSTPIPVKGKLNGADFLANIVKYQGEYRLYLSGIMLKNSGLKLGEIANVEIEFDPIPRIEKIHPKFAVALNENPKARSVFEKFPPSRQKEVLRYLNNLKSEKTLDKNIQSVIQNLLGKNGPKLSFLPRRLG